MINQTQAMKSEALPRKVSSALPYRVSFIDSIMDFVQRLPIPYWLTYLLLFILEVVINLLLSWVDGWLPAFNFSPLALIFPLWLWGPLAIMTYLNSVSQETLSSFSPLLEVEEERLQRLKLEFSSMPARNVLLNSLFWFIVYCLLNVILYKLVFVGLGLKTFLTVAMMIEGLVSFTIGGAIYYHSFRQLRLVNRTVRMVKQFNLFRLDPVYAFSRLTSQIGISWMVMLSLTLLFYPLTLANVLIFGMLVLQILMAVAAFVLPLWFVNRRLAAGKSKLLAEHDQRLETTLGRLHHCIDENKLDEVGQLNSTLGGLKAEREVLTGIPIWPWSTGTLTGFVSAIILPIVLFVIQMVLGKLLGS